MSVEITGLDIAIRRMQSIEGKFQSLAKVNVPKSNDDFQNILNAQVANNDNTQDKVFSANSYQTSPNKISKENLDELIEKYSEKNELDSDFVKAVINQESGFNSTAKSHCGAMGLMQLMPKTASSLGVNNAFNPEENIAGGTKYLKDLIDKFDGDKELALAAYNAGPGTVNKYGGVPPYKETQNYVKNILSNYQKYQDGGVL